MKTQKYNLIARSRSHYIDLEGQTVYSCQKEETMAKHCAKMMLIMVWLIPLTAKTM
ncbi:MAG: hypothetical protein II453_18815 [Alphaproteobacteria bacterium]|nr:hypothetical protein [Alphaproteobacteria bacterium]